MTHLWCKLGTEDAVPARQLQLHSAIRRTSSRVGVSDPKVAHEPNVDPELAPPVNVSARLFAARSHRNGFDSIDSFHCEIRLGIAHPPKCGVFGVFLGAPIALLIGDGFLLNAGKTVCAKSAPLLTVFTPLLLKRARTFAAAEDCRRKEITLKTASRILVAVDSSLPSPPAFEQGPVPKLLTFVATAVLVLAFSSAAAAQTGAVLSGVVHDRAGGPVPGVVLTIVDPTEGDTRVAISDSHGRYLVDRLHYGMQYRVDVSHPRFRKSRVQARANEGDTAVDIALVPPRSRFARMALFPLRVLSFGVIE